MSTNDLGKDTPQSGIKGINYHKNSKKWEVRYRDESGNVRYGGVFADIKDAKRTLFRVLRYQGLKPLPSKATLRQKEKRNTDDSPLLPATPTVTQGTLAIGDKPKSGIPGITWHTQTKKWHVALRRNGINYFAGLFFDLQSAKFAMEQMMLKNGLRHHTPAPPKPKAPKKATKAKPATADIIAPSASTETMVPAVSSVTTPSTSAVQTRVTGVQKDGFVVIELVTMIRVPAEVAELLVSQ
jgi:hypothetical protein